MKVFNPEDNPTHVLQFMPRYESAVCSLTIRTQGATVYTLEDEDTAIIDGYHYLPFEYEFTAGQEYTMEVTTKDLVNLLSDSDEVLTDEFNQPLNVTGDDEVVIYRCKAFATIQTDLQNYKINPSVITI